MPSQSRFLSLLSEESYQSYMGLLLLCGVSMLFAIPFAARVSQHTMFKAFFVPSLFFLTYTFLMSVVGVRRGSLVASAEHGWRAVAAVCLQVLLAQILVLPYLIYVRAVLTASEPRIALVAAYSLLVALLSGFAGYHIERLAVIRRKPTLLLKSLVVLAYFVTPFALGLVFPTHANWLSPLSPLGAVLQILERGSSLTTLIAFALPATGTLLLLLTTRRTKKVVIR